MANFDLAVEKVLLHEGGYSDLAADRGGETYKGVARNHHPGWPGWELIEQEKGRDDFPACLAQNEELDDWVKQLYRAQYWAPIAGDRLPEQAIAEELFDTGVNMGVRRAARFLQSSINLLNRDEALQADLIVDGAIGHKTLYALKKTIQADNSHRYIMLLLNLFQGLRYVTIMQARPGQEVFARGWLNRTV